jgi:SAM-dependent methyltransferase
MNARASPFDRELVRRHLARAKPLFNGHNVLFDEAAAQLRERLGEIKRSFPQACDLSPFPYLTLQGGKVLAPAPLPDEEAPSFSPHSFDLITSNLALHWVNDLPGSLARFREALKPDGLFLASLIGGESLRELRECLMEAELNVAKGVSPRFSPMIDLQTAGNLLRRAQFHLPVADIETVTLLYKDVFSLMRELRGTGQTNAHVERLRRFTRREVFEEAASLYKSRFVNAEGLLPATFDIIYLHGWK